MEKIRPHIRWKSIGPKIFIFVLAFTGAMAFFLRPSAEELTEQHHFDAQIVAALPGPRPPHLIVTLTAAWCGICHGQFKEMQQKYAAYDFSQGDYQWWALNIDPATEDSLQQWWGQENLTLKLLLPGKEISSLVQELSSIAIPIHLLIKENTWQRISYRKLKSIGKKVWGKNHKNN